MRTVLRKQFSVVSFVRAILTGFGAHFCLEIGEIVSLHETLVNRHGSTSLYVVYACIQKFHQMLVLIFFSHRYLVHLVAFLLLKLFTPFENRKNENLTLSAI